MRTPKAITCVEFNSLPLEEKVALLHREGVYVGKTLKEHFVVLLYQIDVFYVEVFYTEFRTHIDHFRCTLDTSVLDQYLEGTT